MIWDWSLYENGEEPTPISPDTRDDWANVAIDWIREGEEVIDISSGDSVVIAIDMGPGEIRVYDCVIRRETTIRDRV